jgi:dTDP-4-amino-4,6-dideoxy-D-galactose acyltransferase
VAKQPTDHKRAPMIARLDLAAIDDLREALPRFAHRPLAHLPYLKRDQVEAYWLDEIAGDVADGSSIAFASRISDRINGLVLYGDSPWDTKVVGRRIAIIKYLVEADGARDSAVLDDLLDEVIRHAASRGTECLTCKVQPLHFAAIHALERHGFLLMDTLLDFLFDFSRTPLENISLPKRLNGLRVRLAQPPDLREVLALSEKAFAKHFGRYHSDPKLPPGTGTKVYDEWVRSSFGGWADWILIAEVNDRIAGYAVWKKASAPELKHSLDIAHLNLAGIHPDFFGRGLYTALALEGMRMAKSFAKHIDGPVHVSNYPVHRALQKLSWRIAGARHSFHKWLNA